MACIKMQFHSTFQLILSLRCYISFGLTSHQHIKGHMATFKVYLVGNNSDAFPCVITGTRGHLSRITDFQYVSWIPNFLFYYGMYAISHCSYQGLLNVKLNFDVSEHRSCDGKTPVIQSSR
jgi:hypothetical protein